MLIIGGNTEVMALGIKEIQARFWITAPTDVSVHREEDYQRMLNVIRTEEASVY